MELVPFLICTFTAAPPASPCSASKLFVTTSTVSMASSPGTKAAQKVIHTYHGVDAHLYVRTDGLEESLFRHFDFICSSRNGWETISPVIVGRGAPGLAGLLVENRNRGSRHDCAGRVRHIADQRAV